MANYYLNNDGIATKKKKNKKGKSYILQDNGTVTLSPEELSDDIAPVKKDIAPTKKRSWFDKGLFDDGYDFGDVSKTILGTVADIPLAVDRGVGRLAEGVGDFIAGGVAQGADILGKDELADNIRNKLAGKDEEFNKRSEKFSAETKYRNRSEFLGVDDSSLFGEKSKDLVSSGGQLLGALAVGGGGIGSRILMGTSAAGSELSNAYTNDATNGEAWLSAGITGVSEVIFEKISGGIKFGGKTLDDLWTKPLTKKITNKTASVLSKFGLDMAGEGAEEVLTEAVQSLGKLSYEHDKTWQEALTSEEAIDNYIESFIGGAVLGGAFNAPRVHQSIKTGRDYETGLTDNEQSVIDAEVSERSTFEKQKKAAAQKEQLINQEIEKAVEKATKRRGDISEEQKKIIEDGVRKGIADIDYNTVELTKKEIADIQKQVNEDLRRGAIDTFRIENTIYQEPILKMRELSRERATANEARQAEIDAELKKLDDDYNALLDKNGLLKESYVQRELRKQAYEPKLTGKETEKELAIIENVKELELGNDRATHEMVDFFMKVARESDYDISLTNNKELEDIGEYKDDKTARIRDLRLELKNESNEQKKAMIQKEIDQLRAERGTIDGFIVEENGKIVLNVESPRAMSVTIGHELSHAIEKSKHYDAFKKYISDYAKTKGVYDKYYNDTKRLYSGVKNAVIEKETIAFLTGDYVFTDQEFVSRLSTEQPNIFKQAYDYIKHLYKMATAGSKEARQLERAKRMFDKAYKEMSRTTTREADSNLTTEADSDIDNTDIRYSMSGEKSLTANKSQLKFAKEMLRKGFDSEAVRKETGWFKGYDGKWRFEIDDSELDLSTSGKFHRNPDIRRYDELVKKVYFSENATEEEVKELQALDKTLEGVSLEPKYLGDLIYHPKLFDAYPELADVRVYFENLNGEANAAYSPFDNSIVVDKHLKLEHSKLKKSLMHEIQHAIQTIEGFTGGSSVSYWQGQKEVELMHLKWKKDELEKSYYKQFNELYNELTELGFERINDFDYDILSDAGLNEVQEFLKESPETIKKLNDFINTREQIGELYDYLSEIKNSNPRDLYLNTAGEIEARDVSNRLLYNEEQRRNEMPDIDNPNAVLAGSNIDVAYKGINKNANLTSNPDIRFSLSAPVEETKDLMAIHNLHVNEVLKQLDLGGMPMPSIAITKTSIVDHEGFGDVTLILNKDAIDPKKSKYNKVYSGDAYTPTFPPISYKVNETVAENIASRVNAIFYDIPEYYRRSLAYFRDTDNINHILNSAGGEQGLIDRYKDEHDLKQLYLAEKGEAVPVVVKETREEMDALTVDSAKAVIEALGEDTVRELIPKTRGPHNIAIQKEWADKHQEELKEVYTNLFIKDGFSPEDAKGIVDEQKLFFWLSEGKKAAEYLQTGGLTVKRKDDYSATNAKIDSLIPEEDYQRWVKDLFTGIEGTAGIRNKKDTFTPAGNRRSFEALHDPVTLENIVKAMRGEEQQKGQAAFGGNLSGASVREYKSIKDIKSDSQRLGKLTKEEHDANNEYISDTLNEIAERYANGKDWWDARNTLVEAVALKESKQAIKNYLSQYDYVYKTDDSIVDDLIELRDYVRGLTTPYFEAKPQRAVGFDEVGVFVIPNNADATLKQKLLEAGYAIAEYNPEIEGDRQNVVNGFEEYKFSLSSSENNKIYVGGYAVYGSDMKRLKDDIAPVKQDVEEVTEEVTEPVIIDEPEADDEYKALTEEDLEQFEQEREEAFRNLPDDYMPAEESEYYNAPDTSPIDDEYLRLVSRNMRQNLGLKNHQMAGLRKIIQDFSTSENQSLESLYNAIESEFGTIQEKKKIDDIAEIKSALRTMRIKVSDVIKGDIPDYAKWKQKQFGKIRIANDGLDVDDVYEGLKSIYPDFFPSDIINPTDQLLRIAEVMDMDSNIIEEYTLPEEAIQEVTDFIYESVSDYKQQKRLDYARELSKAPIDESMIPYNASEKADIAPVKSNFDSHDFTVSRGVQQKYDTETGDIIENEMDVEIEKLERKRKQALDDLGDLTTFTQRKVNELYEEVRSMTKGNRVSTDLGFILDRMFKGVNKQDPDYETIKDGIYKNITDAMLNIERNPAKPETQKSYTETLIRDAIEKRYTWTVDDINSWELDPVAKTKRELRKTLIEPGFLEKALEKAKNIPMALMNNTDTIRNTELVFGRENGKTINDLIFQKAIDNEAKSIAWQNKERAEIAALGINAKDRFGRVTKESEAVQKYGEGKYLDDTGDYVIYDDVALERDFPNPDDRAKIIRAARVIREKYDIYIDTANDVLTNLGFEPIPKRDDYMRHFQELNDVFTRFGIPFNAQNMQEHTLPTDVNGLTEFWSPQKNYFANIQPRKGMRTTLDGITGIDGYIGGIANLIYHTEDIQRGRAFEDLIRETYGETKGWENLEKLPEEEQAARAEKIQDNHLSNYAAWVHEWTNNMAGKKNKIDRSIESMFGRKAFSFLDETRKQVGSNMIGLNLYSSLTNLIASVQAISKTNKLAVAKGTADTIKNIFVKDNFMENNSFLTSRMGTEMLSKTAWQRMRDAGYVFMKGMDWFSSNQIVRSKFYELRSKGMSEEQAHAEAGKFAARIMGDRTKGANAQLYNSKLVGLVTQFQLEVNNQLYSMFYDTYHESKENAKNDALKTAAGMTFTLGQLFAFTHVFGKTFESLAGYNPTFDVIGIIATALGLDDDDEDKPVSERLKEASDKLVDALPYVNILTGGGRIPIASGIPNLVGVATGGKDNYGNELKLDDELKKLLFLIPPTGGNQIKKTTQGLAMFDKDNPVPGSYTDSGSLRFPVEDTPLNRLQAGIFGQWSNENARNYFDNKRKPLKEKQIQEFKDLDIPIADYWKYREGLKEQKTLEDKFDYIAGLDFPVSKKNIMINNEVNRDEKVGLINYDDFSSYDEFDFATKYPEKYSFLESIGATYKDYSASEESKEAYNWAYNNRDKYSLVKAVSGDVVKYRDYAASLNNIKADKDSNGKTISGSRKLKVAEYLSSLDADYGAKLILFKSEYKSDDRYNNDIIDYLNNRQDISYDEMVEILKELGFIVDSQGNVRW